MALPSLLLIVLFFTSLHACDARRLRISESSSSISRLEPSPISQGFRMNQPERSLDKNPNDKASSLEIVGIEILKGIKKNRRLAMELPLNDKENMTKSDENEVGEDMVVMDYAQPHRKPPIHNEKP